MWEMLTHAVTHAVTDTLRLLPFLLLTYWLMEILEQKTGEKAEAAVRRAGKWGPLWGGILGAAPQCGFSAAASSLYAGRVLTVGTLLAVFLSTSDEMVPIMLSGIASGQAEVSTLVYILISKVLLGAITGFLVDLLWRRNDHIDIHLICEQEHCDCEEGAFKSAVKHTVKIALYLLVIGLAINLAIEWLGEDTLHTWFTDLPVLGVVISALIGLIPNCAASVAVTQLYLDGVITTGAMLAGLLTGAGVGLLVLFRLNRRLKENLIITGVLFGSGVVWGLLVDLIGLVF
ncbi:MAG: arsenic efflux protein [Clostridia bacterium]|nr:arsenic efflux protein [Clostridia bacterium]